MKYFTLYELCKSDTAKKQNIDNFPTWEVADNLKELVINVLDPLREMYGKPIIINSGYRSKTLNKAVKGSNTSDHMSGRAADIDAGSIEENKKLFDYIKDNFEFDQLIDEKNLSWVHVSFRKNNNRKQILYTK